MSPTSFALLSGAGIVKGKRKTDTKHSEPIYVHSTYDMVVENVGGQLIAPLTSEDRNNAQLVISREAPVYPVVLDSAGAQEYYLSAVRLDQVKYLSKDGKSLEDTTTNARGLLGGELDKDGKNDATNRTIAFVLGGVKDSKTTNDDIPGDSRQDENVHVGDTVRIDCYEAHYDEAYEMSIAADEFPGYYYIEADTLFRDEATGADLPAEFIIPRGKIQGNFTFTMAASGDPSTFDFKIDCFPAYTKFNRKKKVQAVLQVIDQTDSTHNYLDKEIMGHGAPNEEATQTRTKDSDFDSWYTKKDAKEAVSVFSQDEDTTSSSSSGSSTPKP